MKLGFGLPSDWAEKRLDDVTVLMTNGFVGTATTHYTDDPDGITYIQGFNVTENGFNLSGIRKVTREFHEKNKKSILQEGDLLTIQTGDIGLTTIVPKELAGSNCHALVITRLDRKLCYPPFYAQLFNSPIFRRLFRRIETGSSMKHLNVGDIMRLTVPVPPLYEQKAIAELLSTWDEAIEKTERLIQSKEKQHRWFQHRLIDDKAARQHWETLDLGSVIRERSERSKVHDEYPVLTSSRRGLFLQSEYFSKKVTSKDNTGYKIMRRGDFTFRSMSDDGRFVFNRLQEHKAGIISPAYGVFYADGVYPEFLAHFLNSSYFAHLLARETQGGTRKALRFSALASMEVDLPSQVEQKRIATILDESRREINLLQKQRDLLKRQKRGLMQKLLTGKWRVLQSQSKNTQREFSSC